MLSALHDIFDVDERPAKWQGSDASCSMTDSIVQTNERPAKWQRSDASCSMTDSIVQTNERSAKWQQRGAQRHWDNIQKRT